MYTTRKVNKKSTQIMIKRLREFNMNVEKVTGGYICKNDNDALIFRALKGTDHYLVQMLSELDFGDGL